ncbi:MAG TPA: hypothetical protein VME43_19740 [Bryobacteraceae bacterium]|nr:hypothetical protein [Bryobacteraceae bacterium]
MISPDAVRDVIAAFASANLVALGERHGAREDAEFRLKLIRDPAFAPAVDDIVIEFANALHQDLLDRFVQGADVAAAELSKIWRDTAQPGAWDSPVYEEFLRAVRLVNAGLPRGRRLRVLAGDPPIDWSEPSIGQHLRDLVDARDQFAASLIEREVLNRDRKALVVYGSLHLYRSLAGTIPERLRRNSKARWFVMVPIAGSEVSALLGAGRASAADPVLAGLADSPLGDLQANDLFEKGTKRVQVVDGKMVLAPAQLFEPGVKARETADAVLYFGDAAPEFVPRPAGIAGTDYGTEIDRRRAILRSLLPR